MNISNLVWSKRWSRVKVTLLAKATRSVSFDSTFDIWFSTTPLIFDCQYSITPFIFDIWYLTASLIFDIRQHLWYLIFNIRQHLWYLIFDCTFDIQHLEKYTVKKIDSTSFFCTSWSSSSELFPWWSENDKIRPKHGIGQACLSHNQICFGNLSDYLFDMYK